ncbi:MAG: TRC40/GET3/ArsA family transport-energizing ATPase [Halanaerobiaceae bacterium]|nr:TRC40/GET3/ArsA family transport-energizing ATPase [Halanaerobiaceae bacterium]
MRLILYTGKGGVGKTSIAAATAVESAKKGLKTLVISADAAHSLGDCFDLRLSPEPVELQKNLWAQEIETIHEAERGWSKVQKYLTDLFTAKAVRDITTEELTILPGIEDLLSLMRILAYYKEKSYDVIIVDCAPTGETLALLSFPDMLRWWMEKLFPIKRAALKVTKPLIEPLLGLPMPSDGVMKEIERIYLQLDEVREILSDREITSVRVVVNPEKMVVKEAQRSFTYLNMYNYNVDAIIVNRVIPEEVKDDYFKAWKEIHKKYRKMIKDSFYPVLIFEVPLYPEEIVGLNMLKQIGQDLFTDRSPEEIYYNTRTQEATKDENGYLLKIHIPFVDKEELSLNQKGEELIIRGANFKRNLILPRTLLNYQVTGARFEDDTLLIRFGGGIGE